LARRFHQISTALFDVEMRRSGLDLTPVQYAALVAVQEQPAIDQATLAGLIAYDRTTIGGVVDRLVEKGFIIRQTSARDRRAKVLTSSPEGKEIIEQAHAAAMRAQETLVTGLSPAETDELVRLLEKSVAALNTVSRTSAH
jgi:DNA-binding MarR family transcriptional regulator